MYTLKKLQRPANINRLLGISEMNPSNSEPAPVSNFTEEEIQEICIRYESLKQCILTIKEFVESGKTEAEWQTFISDEIVPLLDG